MAGTDATAPEDVFVLDSQDGPLVFDRGAAVLTRGDDEIHLTNTEFRLLSVLAENAGRVLEPQLAPRARVGPRLLRRRAHRRRARASPAQEARDRAELSVDVW